MNIRSKIDLCFVENFVFRNHSNSDMSSACINTNADWLDIFTCRVKKPDGKRMSLKDFRFSFFEKNSRLSFRTGHERLTLHADHKRFHKNSPLAATALYKPVLLSQITVSRRPSVFALRRCCEWLLIWLTVPIPTGLLQSQHRARD